MQPRGEGGRGGQRIFRGFVFCVVALLLLLEWLCEAFEI